jgi:predicted nucleic acid-binding protein
LIFVDTSVWVAAFRGRDPRAARALEALLDDGLAALAGPVRLELLSGASSATHRKLRRVLGALPVFHPGLDTWATVESWIERAVAAGQRFGVMDLLIGAIAAERGGQVWSFDDDFVRLARMRLVKLYSPPT